MIQPIWHKAVLLWPRGKKGPFSHLHSLLSNRIHTAQSHPLQTEISTSSALKPPYLQRIRPPLWKDNACSKNCCSVTNSSLGKHYWAQNCCLSSCHFLTVPSNSGNAERTSSSRSSNARCFRQTGDCTEKPNINVSQESDNRCCSSFILGSLLLFLKCMLLTTFHRNNSDH